ncbi:hypothetical protein F5Y13DRAFT_200057 [Hypoxylon sp. FL1857]|nr:hypothetical protein F5Y13DRAFT_200057 [Hypoxylon sp. FL1857]
MDEDSIDIDDWRRLCLGDEPIYCAAPPPSSQDDIICFGSDEELDDAAKVSKRLRYEAQGLRYLQGKSVRIMSASLRGPFDKASGWKNPWLPKQPAIEKSVSQPSQPTSKPLPAIKQRLLKRFEQDDATTNTDGSMCYDLPSPRSNRDLQLPGNSLESDKRSQIQAWAKEVSAGTVLERDDFWAPRQALYEDPSGPNKKRPAGKEWLKTKPSKRQRPNTSQFTATASTPTRKPQAGTPTRSISLPIDNSPARKPAPPKTANQSFQLSTPTSTNRSRSGIPYKRLVEAPTNHETTPPQGGPSEDSTLLSTIMTVDDIHDQSSPADGEEFEQASTSETSGHSTQASEGSTNGEVQESQSAEETGLESFLDQSFHYRSRHPKQTTPLDVPMTESHPGPAQNGPPESLTRDVMKIEVAEAEEQFTHIESVTTNKASENVLDLVHEQNIQNEEEQLSVSLPLEKMPNSEQANETKSSKDEKMSIQRAAMMRIDSVCNPISPKTADAHHIETKGLENEDIGMAHDDSHESQAPLQGEVVQTAVLSEEHTPVELHPGKSELSVDEESTLIGDPADFNDSMVPVIGGLPTIHASPNTQNVEPVTAVELHSTTQKLEGNAEQDDESDGEANPVMVPLSQLEWGIAEVADTARKPEIITSDKTGNADVKVEEVPGNYTLPQATLLDSPEIVTRQSPRITDPPSGADPTIKHIKSEPPDDEPSHSPCPSHHTLLSSHSDGHGTPKIRASQQSPWGGALSGPMRIDQQDQRLATPTTTTFADVPFATSIPEEHQSPWAGTNTSFLSPYPTYPPTSPILAAHDEKLSPPFLRLSIEASGPDDQQLESSTNNPTTPPRVPAPRLRTPDLEKLIKPFYMFNSPSPPRRPRQSIKPYSSTNGLRGILSSTPRSNPWSSQRSSRRVSFANLPNDGDDANTLQTFNTTRPASPPPQANVNAEDEDVDIGFQNHFDVMKRRATGENVQAQFQPRLLPSSSQQKPMSPAINAMAKAFQEADAHMAHAHENPVGIADEETVDQEMADEEQSPWQKESEEEEVDYVAEVMNNLDDFLNAWDVDTELRRAR